MAEVSTYVRDGKAFLRDETGNLTTHDVAKAGERVLSGRYSPVTAEEVQARDAEKAGGDALGTAAAFGEATAAAAFDAVTAPAHIIGAGLEAAGVYDKSPTAGMSGRKLLENVTRLTGGDARAAEYRQNAEARAEGAPIASGAGTVLGTVLGGMGVSRAAQALGSRVAAGTGSKVLGTGVAGAAEGTVLGAATAPEEAYFKDEDLTAEAVLGGMGWGALLGGGVGLATGGAAKLFGRAGSRGSTPVDSPSATSKRLDAPMEETAERILGTPPAPGLGEKLRDAVEGAQSVAAGAERETLQSFGALRWDNTARRGRALWRDREKILEGATGDLTAHVDELVTQSRKVMDEVVDTGLKRDHIASKLSGDTGAQLAAARAESAKLRQSIAEMMPPPPRPLADAANDIVEDEGLYGNRALLGRVQQYIGQLDSSIQGSDDAADAFIGLDKAKRALQRWTVTLRDSGRMSTDALKREQSFALGKKLGELQEGTRQVLMQDGVWGQAAIDQKGINAAWEKFFESKRLFDSHFITRTGSDFETGAIVAADPAKVASYVRRLGRSEAALVDQHFRAHVQALDELTGAIGGAFDVGEKAAAVETVRQSAKKVAATLAKADETVKVANQIDAVIEAEKGGGMSTLGSVLGGGLLGGAPGALIGAFGGMVSRPGQMIRQAAALDVLAQNLDKKIGKSISGFFARNVEPSARAAQLRLPGRTTITAASRVAAAAPVPTALEVFRGKAADNVAAYREKVAEVYAANENYGQRVRERANVALGDIPNRTPRLAGKLVTTATKGAQFLQSKVPVPLTNPRSLTPRTSAPVPSDVEIAKFATYYNAVSNPVSVVRDFEQGSVTREQIEALQVVYPKLYARIREQVMEQLMRADERGVEIPYDAKIQLNILLDLGGAGEPTATPEFMSRYQDMAAQIAEQAAAAPAQKPVKLGATLSSGMDAMRKDLS